jgi:hypothetical protein
MPHARDPSWHSAAFAVVIAVVLGGLVLHASYPGYLNADSFEQLRQILAGRIDDWQSPFVTLLWSALLVVLPGPVGIIVVDNLLIWGALAALVIELRRSVGAWALAVLAIPLLPGLFNYLGHVHRDTMLLAWLLASFALAFLANSAARGPRSGLALQLLANLGAIGAFLIRPNAIFCTIPLLFYANRSFGRKRNLAACGIVLLLMPASYAMVSSLAQARATNPGDSIKTYHLLALSYFAGKNLFPGRWTPEESRQIVESCYSPVQWDAAGMQGNCGFIQIGLVRQGLWGSPALTGTWLREAATRPLALYSAMAATFTRSMRDPNSRAMLYKPPKSARIDWEVATDPPRTTTALAQAYMRSTLNDEFGRPWVFALLFVAGTPLLLARDLIATPIGLFSAAVLASGAIYLLGYFPFNVSAEYRYFYWSGFAAFLGTLLAAMAWWTDKARRTKDGRVRPNRIVCVLLAAIAAAVAGLVAVPVELPTWRRVVAVTALDDDPVTLARLHTASIPVWMGIRFEGRIDAGGWVEDDGGFRAQPGAGPLIATISGLHQAIRLGLRTGPHAGRVGIEADGRQHVLDTRAESAGELVFDLPPPARAADLRLDASPRKPVMAALCFAAVFSVLMWLSLGQRGRLG